MDPNTKALIMGAAGGAAADKVYVEDVFSTWLYTGNGTTQTITNGIDLAGEGGLVWIKSRSGALSHALFDTARGLSPGSLSTNFAFLQQYADITSFNNNGFSLTNISGWANNPSVTYTSWTFRKAEKFFDVVTYTGNGSNRTIAHSLGSVPGCIIVKRTDTTGDWQVYHRSLANTEYLVLNSTAAKATGATRWNSTTPTSTEFSLGTDATVNANGGTYVAYLFAHDAGGFGDSGNDNVVSCGSYTGNGSASGPTVTLGWEPQWVMIKNASATGNWFLFDTMRGIPIGAGDEILYADLANAANTAGNILNVNATGFQITATGSGVNTSSDTYIYIAIRRGPMKTPTDATKVFAVNYETEARSTTGWTSLSGFADDAFWMKSRNVGFNWEVASRLTVMTLSTNTTAAEQVNQYFGWDTQNGIKQGTTSFSTNSSYSYADYHFRRAPGFFDVVAYTFSGSGIKSISHNLATAPQLFFAKQRDVTSGWYVYSQTTGKDQYLLLNSTSAAASLADIYGTTAPTATEFYMNVSVGGFTGNWIFYLFSTLTGVSKVGSYTGTGTTKQIDCGFTSGARFVLIKRTDSTGDWYVWDTARGIVSGNDPYLLINDSAAEVTNTDYIDPLNSGFEISSTAPAAINANGGTFIYLAVA